MRSSESWLIHKDGDGLRIGLSETLACAGDYVAVIFQGNLEIA